MYVCIMNVNTGIQYTTELRMGKAIDVIYTNVQPLLYMWGSLGSILGAEFTTMIFLPRNLHI